MPFNAALSGLQAANNQLRVLANNIANASTVGFKRSRAEFGDVYAVSTFGSSDTNIGTGVSLNTVSQQFTQGIVSAGDSNLDLAINGTGFFVLEDADGSRSYTRAGQFQVDKDGDLVNGFNQGLLGFLADEQGNISGAQGILSIENTILAPSASTTIDARLNLNSEDEPPMADFVSGFTPTNPPESNTYNYSTQVEVFDTLGNSHIVTSYFVKAPAERTWQVHVGVDGVDTTPTAATPPAGTPSTPGSYTAGTYAQPFTLVFDTSGAFVLNNVATPPLYYGNTNPTSWSTADPTLGSFDTSTTANGANLTNLAIGDLAINGEPIAVSTIYDTVSTKNASASAITLASTINETTALHRVTATPNATFADLGAWATGTPTAGSLIINDIAVFDGVTAYATTADVVAAINAANIPGVSAADNAGNLEITGSGGINLDFTSDGSSPAGVTLGNFDIANGAYLERVDGGSVTLSTSGNQGITLSGNNPGAIGFSSGTLYGIGQTSSDVISINFDPASGALDPQTLEIDYTQSTQYGAEFAIIDLKQDGYSVGRLTSVEVDQTGIITARYGNGQSEQLGQVALARFDSPQNLLPKGDNAWTETFSSGVALLGAPATSSLGLIASKSLEQSNVQLTDELVGLIEAQRNFQANAQTIKTGDAVTQTIINIR